MAQFRELAAFAQFGSDLDKATQDQLNRGLRVTEVLKQPQYQPMSLEHQVTILFAVINGFLDDVPINRIRVFESAFLDYVDRTYPHLGQALASEKVLSEETETALRLAIEDFKTSGTY
jgi:F-type H+-transporting ATPase subunit alpha